MLVKVLSMYVPEVRVWSDALGCSVYDPTLVNGQRPARFQESVQPIQHRWAAIGIKHLNCAIIGK